MTRSERRAINKIVNLSEHLDKIGGLIKVMEKFAKEEILPNIGGWI